MTQEAVSGPYVAHQAPLAPLAPLLPKMERTKFSTVSTGEALTPGIVASSPSTSTSSVREGRMATPRCQASPSQLPPVKTPKEKKTRPAPLTGLPGCSQRASSKDAEEGRRAFDLGSAVTRGSAHSGRLTPRAELPGSLHSNGTPSHGLRSHHLPLPTSVPGSSGAFTSSSVGDMLEVSGLEELERLGKCWSQWAAPSMPLSCGDGLARHVATPAGAEVAAADKTQERRRQAALNQELRRAPGHAFLGLAAQRAGEMDLANVVICLGRIAKMIDASRGNRHRLEAAAQLAPTLLTSGASLASGSTSWHSLANLAWAACRLDQLDLEEPKQALQAVLVQAEALGLDMAPGRDLAVLIWALAWAQRAPESRAREPSRALVAQLRQALPLRLPELQPQGLAMLLWSFGALEAHQPVPRQTYRSVLQQVEPEVANLKAREVANVVWSVATVQATMPGWLLQQLPERAAQFAPQECANVLWALAVSGQLEVMSGLVQSAEQGALADFGAWKPQEMASAAWALAIASSKGGRALAAPLSRLRGQAPPRIQQLEGKELAMLASALLPEDAALASRISHRACELLVAGQLAPDAVVQLRDHLSRTGAVPELETAAGALQEEVLQALKAGPKALQQLRLTCLGNSGTHQLLTRLDMAGAHPADGLAATAFFGQVLCQVSYDLRAGSQHILEEGRIMASGGTAAEGPLEAVTLRFPRHRDAEFLALSSVLASLREAQMALAEVQGSVRLHATHTPCLSCVWAMVQFREACPGVRLQEKHRHLPTGRELALKILQAADIAEPQRKAILLELRTFSKCRSPHIVDFYGAFFHENNIYMALEYMNAGALSATLAAKKKAIPDFHVPDRLLANITWQVLDGLEYLHSEMHVIHRDIKPSNLLLSTTGIVKITDFGVSGELEDDLEHKNKVTFVGTIHYMSPERVVGKPYKYNSDTWSLGLTLMECVLMRYPYAREEEVGYKFSFWELMRRIDKQEPPSLPPCPQYSPKLQEFLQEALQKDPEHRPGAAAMKAHGWLEGFQSGHLVELAMWIAQTPEEAPRTGPSRPLRHGPNPFQGGYSSSGPSKVPDREMPPRLPEGSLRPPRCPASSGGHTAASSPDASDTRRSDSLPVDMPKMDQSWHGGRCNPFSAFQAEVGASPEARSRTSSRGAEGEFLS
ncbi:unnamed protein product [Effrenium voratum]|nr:unnamed protein product [Effrenium voratum]